MKFIILFMLLISADDQIFAQCGNADIVLVSKPKCIPSLVRYAVAPAQPSGTVFYWDPGDGTGVVNGNDTFYHNYNKSGNYAVSVTFITPSGSKCTISKPAGFVSLVSAKSLGFYADNTKLCSNPAVVSLHDTTTNILKRDWYVDGQLLNDHSRNIFDTIVGPGYHSVILVVTNTEGCYEIVDKNNYILVPQPISMDFCSLLEEDSLHKTLTATFKPGFDTTGLHIISTSWSFPGGVPSSSSSFIPPKIKYSDLTKFYTPQISIMTASGCFATFTKKNLIGQYSISGFPTYCASDIVNLKYTGAAIYPQNSEFYFIKSNLRFTGQINTTGHQSYLKFLDPGIASFYFGIRYFTSSCIDSVYIPDMLKINPPVAQFTASEYSQCSAPAKITFYAYKGNSLSGSNLYSWHFYDAKLNELPGSPYLNLSGTDTSFNFNDTGVYSVKLTVTNAATGCKDSIFKKNLIRINSPDINYSIFRDTICAGDTLRIVNHSILTDLPGNSLYYDWGFKNQIYGSVNYSSRSRSPIVKINVPGSYRLSYTYGTGSNCKKSVLLADAFFVNGVISTLSVSGSDGCPPLVKTLSAQTKYIYPPSTGLNYSWHVDPQTAQIINPSSKTTSVIFNKQGCYTVSCRITTSEGCQSEIVRDTPVCIGTIPDFSIQGKVCKNVELNIVNLSSDNADQFHWSVIPDSGVDLKADTLKTPSLTFLRAGCFKIVLKTSNSMVPNCFNSDTQTVCINPGPVISDVFSPDSNGHCAPQYDSFFVASQNCAGYYWNFGDSSTLSTADSAVMHAYFKNNSSGYNVSVVGSDSLGCISDTFKLDKYIKIAGPEPSFIITSKPPCREGIVDFTNTSKNVFDFYFSYGDNSHADSNAINSHFYKYTDYSRDSNIYIPTLFAYDKTGCAASASAVVKLFRPPVVSAFISDSSGCEPYLVKFNNKSIYTTQYLWSFGDRSFDTSYSPIHIFTTNTPDSSDYVVKMIAKTLQGCADSIIPFHIKVYQTPKATESFAGTDYQCYKDSIHFSGASDMADSKYFWSFGDVNVPDDTSNLQNPVYHYITPGKHTVVFKVISPVGCVGTVTDSGIITLDSLPPVRPVICYVTVNQNNQVVIVFNKNSYPRFKYNTVNRLSPFSEFFRSPDEMDTVVTDTAKNIDPSVQSYSYAATTSDYCGYTSAYSRVHTTIHLAVSKPGNQELLLQWNSYRGWDSVSGYELYRKTGQGSFNLFAKLSSADSSYLDTALCPAYYSYFVQAISPGRQYASSSNVAGDSPVYIMPSLAPVIRYATVINNKYVKVKWDSVSQPDFKEYVIDRKINTGAWDYGYDKQTGNSLIDNNTDINRNYYQYRVTLHTGCGFSSPQSNEGTSILLKGIIFNDSRLLFWNPYYFWKSNVAAYIVQLKNNSGTYFNLKSNSANDTAYSDGAAYQDIMPTCYRVYALENTSLPALPDTSMSNMICLNLPSRIFMPNTFTPDGDGVNDSIKPIGVSIRNSDAGSKDIYDFKVYNRWGELVFETHDSNEGWDGKYNGKNAPQDVYYYLIDALGTDWNVYHLKGNITLFRK